MFGFTQTRLRLALLCSFCSATFAQEYSPAVARDFPTRALFGDLHLHSNLSADAFSMGNAVLGPEISYRFARGEEVHSSNGIKAQLRQPLDFLAVTDHAEFLGLYKRYAADDPLLSKEPLNQKWNATADAGDSVYMAFPNSITDPDVERDYYSDALKNIVWDNSVRLADEYNQPGVFTTFAGYEWTSMVDGNNLHRCVIYKDNADLTRQVLPYSAQTSRDPEDLWRALEHYEETTGGDVIAIPHNGNLSNGMMWALETLDGQPLDADYAQRRTTWEPVAEVTQIKGDSETHPLLSPDDPFAAFERWDEFNILNSAATQPHMLPGSHARSALKRGLQQEAVLGVNPFKFGMIGSTDDHTSLATAAEDNFFGKFPNSEPGIRTPHSKMAGALNADWKLSASGLAVVWARENTRAEIFEAIERREVYATTGSRILLRFFGGWGFPTDTINQPDFETRGYQDGVPMGSDLPARPEAAVAPTFMIFAQRDPNGANLDQLEIIKGWVSEDGASHEKIFYVALSDNRQVDPSTGKPSPVGTSIDEVSATYSNTIGSAALATQWTDPEFDPNVAAFYYARVIEIPTPRWTEYDRVRLASEPYVDAPKTVQDRAYSSPIWYHP